MLGYGPLCSRPLLALPEMRAHVAIEIDLEVGSSATVALYAATVPFITMPADDPANTPFNARLMDSLVISRSIVGGDGYAGYQQNISELSLINADGEYDTVADEYSVNGRDITIKVGLAAANGEVEDAYATFETVAIQLGERLIANRDRLLIEHTDHAAKLDVPAQPNVYAGVGGLEGGEEIAGKRRPIGLSDVYNGSPVLVIASEGLFQCHDGAVASIGAVKDGGIELDFVADYATVALLRAAIASTTTVPAGFYATCIAEGYFGIGGIAFKQVTVDFTLSTQTTADIIEWLVLNSTELTAADLDDYTFDDLNNAQSAVRQFYLGADDTSTVAEVMTALMRGIHGWWRLSSLGKLGLMRMEAPGMVAAASYDLEGGNLVTLDSEPLPEPVDPPPRRRRVTWAHNFTQQSDLYGQVAEGDPALADYLSKPYKIAPTSDGDAAVILADFPFAPDPEPILGYFRDQADAQAEADRVFALYSSGYRAFSFTARGAFCMHQPGEVVTIADSTIAPRLGLTATPRYVRLVEVADNARDFSTAMKGFG